LELIVARRKAKLTQAGLANKLGISQGMVAQWESKIKPIPKEKQTQLKELLATHLEK
jgi:DNA-binding transcriptional regulator YiaG